MFVTEDTTSPNVTAINRTPTTFTLQVIPASCSETEKYRLTLIYYVFYCLNKNNNLCKGISKYFYRT